MIRLRDGLDSNDTIPRDFIERVHLLAATAWISGGTNADLNSIQLVRRAGHAQRLDDFPSGEKAPTFSTWPFPGLAPSYM